MLFLSIGAQFHSCVVDKIAYQKNKLSRFSWLPAKLEIAFCLHVCPQTLFCPWLQLLLVKIYFKLCIIIVLLTLRSCLLHLFFPLSDRGAIERWPPPQGSWVDSRCGQNCRDLGVGGCLGWCSRQFGFLPSYGGSTEGKHWVSHSRQG